jgi:hypothetical protein
LVGGEGKTSNLRPLATMTPPLCHEDSDDSLSVIAQDHGVILDGVPARWYLT